MNKSVLALTLSLAAMNAQAGISLQYVELCQSIGNYAKQIMIGRQNGTDLSLAYSHAQTIGNDNTTELLQTIIVDSYNTPIYSSYRLRKNAVSAFQGQYFSACVKQFSNQQTVSYDNDGLRM